MSKLLVRSMSLALALVGSIGFALAQDKVDSSTTQQLKKQDTVPPATGRNLPEQAGTQEPSSKVQGTNPNAEVLINAGPGSAAL